MSADWTYMRKLVFAYAALIHVYVGLLLCACICSLVYVCVGSSLHTQGLSYIHMALGRNPNLGKNPNLDILVHFHPFFHLFAILSLMN